MWRWNVEVGEAASPFYPNSHLSDQAHVYHLPSHLLMLSNEEEKDRRVRMMTGKRDL